jgi:hypothetical protein
MLWAQNWLPSPFFWFLYFYEEKNPPPSVARSNPSTLTIAKHNPSLALARTMEVLKSPGYPNISRFNLHVKYKRVLVTPTSLCHNFFSLLPLKTTTVLRYFFEVSKFCWMFDNLSCRKLICSTKCLFGNVKFEQMSFEKLSFGNW